MQRRNEKILCSSERANLLPSNHYTISTTCPDDEGNGDRHIESNHLTIKYSFHHILFFPQITQIFADSSFPLTRNQTIYSISTTCPEDEGYWDQHIGTSNQTILPSANLSPMTMGYIFLPVAQMFIQFPKPQNG